MGINMKFPVKNKMAMIYNERSLIHSWASLTGWKARGEAGGQASQGDGSSIKSNLNQPRIGEFGDFGCGLSNYLREARQSNWNHVKVWPNVKNTKFPTKFDLSCFHFSSSQLIIFFLENDVRFSEISSASMFSAIKSAFPVNDISIIWTASTFVNPND